jgi:hypothetical protein
MRHHSPKNRNLKSKLHHTFEKEEFEFSKRISLQGLSPGIYEVKVTLRDKTFVERVAVVH